MKEQALKIKLFQETACYRNPVTMEVIESYPLPPPSTISGLFTNIIAEDIRKIDLSIQGSFDGLMRDYQLYIKWGKVRPYPIVVNMLFNTHLCLHIKADEGILKKLGDAFKQPPYYFHLGRSEDLIKIEKVTLVDIKNEKADGQLIDTPVYIKKEIAKEMELNGILYKLPTFFSSEKIKIKKQEIVVRNFEWKDFIYVESETIEDGFINIDDEGDIVWWSGLNQNLQRV